MERLGAAEDRGQRFQRGAHDVVLGLLRRERRAARLRVEAQHHRLRGFFAPNRSFMIARPQPPSRPELRDLLEEVHVACEEERKARSEVVDVETRVDRGLHVGDRRRRS